MTDPSQPIPADAGADTSIDAGTGGTGGTGGRVSHGPRGSAMRPWCGGCWRLARRWTEPSVLA